MRRPPALLCPLQHSASPRPALGENQNPPSSHPFCPSTARQRISWSSPCNLRRAEPRLRISSIFLAPRRGAALCVVRATPGQSRAHRGGGGGSPVAGLVLISLRTVCEHGMEGEFLRILFSCQRELFLRPGCFCKQTKYCHLRGILFGAMARSAVMQKVTKQQN